MLSAFLLFAVEPMATKALLPLFGGGPSVWTTAVLLFQVLLLAGYLYAHVIQRAGRAQWLIHLAVLCLPLLWLPLDAPAAAGDPPVAVIAALAASIGPAFFVLASSGPLLQRWFAARSTEPYVLFAASNLGSFAGLLAYPFLVEPVFGLGLQRSLWSFGYGVAAVALAVCAFLGRDLQGSRSAPTEPIRARATARWLLLAAFPVSVTLGTTTYLTTDIAPMPLLWVVPLALYLLSFVVPFGLPGNLEPIARWGARGLKMLVLPTLTLVILEAADPIALIVALGLAAMFSACLACHSALAHSRPPAERSTAFYLVIATGGVLGGAFNALVAPVLFETPIEYPLALIGTIACLAWVTTSRFHRIELNVIGLVGALGLFGGSLFGDTGEVVYRDRTFYGIHTVERRGELLVLRHGNTLHGSQDTDPARAATPLAYYHPSGPAGDIFAERDASDVAYIGLGTGAATCLADEDSTVTIFELDPEVVAIARDLSLFSYLSDCDRDATIVVGDGRLGIAGAAEGSYDVIVVDAFSSDSIPVHLLTREALALYRSKLRPDGAIAIHLSNRYLDLDPVIVRVAKSLGLSACVRGDSLEDDPVAVAGKLASRWAAVGDGAALAGVCGRPGWLEPSPSTDIPLWTDDRSDLLSILRWR